MATTTHSSLTGANLHEPKGVASADAGTVYIADGAGSGSWAGVTPIGGVMNYAGTTAPSLWLFCYGQAISRTTYADLFTAIGTTYGTGDGSTTFNLPDCRGRVVAGQDDMGGTSANRLTDAYTGGLNGDVLGDTGGEEAHSLTAAENGPHSHTVLDRWTTGTGGSGSGAGPNANTSSTNTTSTSGSGTAHNNVQPTIILNTIIYTGVA